MTKILSINTGDSPAVAPDAPAAKATQDAVKPFDFLLANQSPDPVATPPAAVATDTFASPGKPEEKQSGDSSKKETDGSEHKPEPDAVMLSSCLAAWQILPPPFPAQPVAPVAGEQAQPVDSKSSVSETSPKVAADAVIDSAANPAAQGTTPQATADSSAPLTDGSPAQPLPSNPSTPTVSTPKAASPQKTLPIVTARDLLTTTPAHPEIARGSKAARPGNPVDIKASKGSPVSAGVIPTTLDGIPVAKEQRAMPDLIFHNPAKSAPAAFAEGETRSKPAHEVGQQAAVAGTSADQSPHDDPQAGMSSEQHEQPGAEPFAMPVAPEARNEAEPAKLEASAKTAASDTAQVIHDIERAIDRMRAQGGQRMEVRLPMRDGEEVVVKLRVEQGEVKATFHAASDELRQALETGWSQHISSSPERAAKAAPTIFESSSMQNGMGGNNQSPSQRDRGDSGRYSERTITPITFPREQKKASDPRPASAMPMASASLELYA